jgi:hypothetical protein
MLTSKRSVHKPLKWQCSKVSTIYRGIPVYCGEGSPIARWVVLSTKSDSHILSTKMAPSHVCIMFYRLSCRLSYRLPCHMTHHMSCHTYYLAACCTTCCTTCPTNLSLPVGQPRGKQLDARHRDVREGNLVLLSGSVGPKHREGQHLLQWPAGRHQL